MTILVLVTIAALVRLRVRPYRRWDVASAVLGLVMAVGVAPGVDTSSGMREPIGALGAAAVTPFISMMAIFLVGRLSLGISDAVIPMTARRRGEDDQGVQGLRTMQETARASYTRWIGPL
ncbi:MAG: hypothetical protein R3C39_14380 [Dehalococcoidia bacterium]